MSKSVFIFRQQLFKLSESFITEQVSGLTGYRPIYVGRERYGPAPVGAEVRCLADQTGKLGLFTKAAHVLGMGRDGYIRLARNHRPTLIHAHFGVDALFALPLSEHHAVPLVTTFHGFDATQSRASLVRSGSISLARYALERSKLRSATALCLCVSQAIRQRVIELGFPEERTRVHYVGVNVDAIPVRVKRPARPSVLHVGRLVEKKGTAHLLRAFARLSTATPDAELRIIGDGPLKASLTHLAASLGIAGKVHFLGALNRDAVLEEMRRATVLAVPSVTAGNGDAEGLPTVILEAAACGVPVIGTRHSGIPEAIDDQVTGCLVAERDESALAERLEHLLVDSESAWTMGMAARRLAEEKFNLRVQSAALERFYDSACS